MKSWLHAARKSTGKSRITGAVAVVLAVVLAWAFFAGNPLTGGGDVTASDAPATSATTAPSSAPVVAPTLRVEPMAHTPGVPDRLLIPEIDVDAPVVGIRAVNRVLDPPPDPDVVGWWDEGARPGAEKGSALITGHSMRAGHGALQDLETLADGDRITVRTDAGNLTYAVQDVMVLDKYEIAEQAEVLFDQSVAGRLVVITCEDWDGTDWNSNVVVTATPL